MAGQLTPLGGAVLLDGQELARILGNARAQKLALMLPHTRRTELTTCFEFAAAGRIPYTLSLIHISFPPVKMQNRAGHGLPDFALFK